MNAPIRRILICFVLLAFALSGAGPALGQQDQPEGYSSNQQGFSAPFDQGIADLDAYWNEVFAKAGAAYRAPQVIRFESPISTPCGGRYPLQGPFYCELDETVYLSFAFLQQIGMDQSGDYTFITIAAHEWGHHIQHLLGVEPAANNRFELQADCLGGAFTQFARTLGRLDPGDVTDAAELSIKAGDDARQAENQPGAHGINDDRLTAFMDGYINGLPACGLPLSSVVAAPAAPSNRPQSVARTARDYLPDQPSERNAACFAVQGQGDYPAADVDAFLVQAGAGERATVSLGWLDGAYIDFRCAEPAPGGANFLEVVVHRFASPALARDALQYWQAGYRPARDEIYRCASVGSVVVCADGSGPDGPPSADVASLLDQVTSMAPSASSTSPASPPLAIPSLIPPVLALSPGQSFRLHDEGAASFDSVVANAPDPATAERQLRAWGWAENYYRVFAADNPPRNAAGWVELSIDRFDSVDGAAQALVADADARRASHNEQGIDLGLFSDQSEAMSGPAYNGNEVTIFARRGDLVVRATGITPKGDPTADVIEAILKILVPLVDEPRVVSSALLAALPSAANMPNGLQLTEEHARSAATIAETFPDSARAEALFQHWGWRENAARVFTGRSDAGTTRIEVSAFRLADADMAAQALDYFLRGRATVDGLTEVAPPDVGVSGLRAIAGLVAGGHEATVYFARGATLFRVTAIGSGDPMRDLAELLRSWR